MTKLKPKTSWEKRFDEKDLDLWGLDYPVIKPIKDFISQELKREKAKLLTEVIILHHCTGRNCSLCRLAEKEGYFDD